MMYFPRWVSWLFVLFLGYILMVGNFRGDASRESSAPPASTAAPAQSQSRGYPALQALTDAGRWRRALNPALAEHSPAEPCAPIPVAADAPGNYAIILREGEGAAAACATPVILRFTLWTPQGNVRTVMEDTPYQLGELPGLGALLVGMRMGEMRLLFVTLPQHIPALPLVMPRQLTAIGVERTAKAVMRPAAPQKTTQP